MKKFHNHVGPADQSGPHRIVKVNDGQVREAISAVVGLGSLTRAGHVARQRIQDLLPGFRAICAAVSPSVQSAMAGCGEVLELTTGLPAQPVMDQLARDSDTSIKPLLTWIDAASGSTFGAKPRLELERLCDVAALGLSQLRLSMEILQQAAGARVVSIAVEDLLPNGVTLERADGSTGELGECCLLTHPPVALAIVQNVATGTKAVQVSMLRHRLTLQFFGESAPVRQQDTLTPGVLLLAAAAIGAELDLSTRRVSFPSAT